MEYEKAMHRQAVRLICLYMTLIAAIVTGSLIGLSLVQATSIVLAILLVASVLLAFKTQFIALRCLGMNGLAIGLAVIGGLLFTYLFNEGGTLHLVSLVPLMTVLWLVGRAAFEVKKAAPETTFLLRFAVHLAGPVFAFCTAALTGLPIAPHTKATLMAVGVILVVSGPRLAHAVAENWTRALKFA